MSETRTRSAANQSPKATGGLVDVMIRRFFYRDSLRLSLKILTYSVVANIGLTAALAYSVVALNNIEPKYFATDNAGRITPLVALDQPYLSSASLLSWASQTAQSVYNYDFQKYKEQLNANRKNFTEAGWNGFVDALTQSKVLQTVNTERQIVSAVPVGAPIIADEGVSNGIRMWKVRVPLSVSYQGPSKIITKNVLVTMVITRTSLMESESGVAVNSFISSDVSSFN